MNKDVYIYKSVHGKADYVPSSVATIHLQYKVTATLVNRPWPASWTTRQAARFGDRKIQLAVVEVACSLEVQVTTGGRKMPMNLRIVGRHNELEHRVIERTCVHQATPQRCKLTKGDTGRVRER